MKTKAILFASGLFVALIAFLAYQWLTGAEWTMSTPAKPSATTQQTTGAGFDRPYVETRLPDGTLQWVMTARHMKQTAVGQYYAEQPRITNYTKDGRVLAVFSDTGIFKIDQVGPLDKARAVYKGATLSGNVHMILGPKASFVSETTELQPGQIQVNFEKDLELDYGARTITSDGKIEIRGDKVWFDGRNLTVAINEDQRRVEYLRIEEGNKLILHQIAGTKLAATPTPTIAPTEPATPSPAPTTAVAVTPAPPTPAPAPTPIKPENQPTVYRLNFGKNVKAVVGDRTLTAQQLTLLFQTTSGEVAANAGKPQPTPDPTPAPLPSATAPKPVVTQPALPVANPATPATPPTQDLTLTWTGPMEMRPDESVTLAGPKDAMIDAQGTPGDPVTVHDGTARTITARRLTYQTAIQKVVLYSSPDEPVKLDDTAVGRMSSAGLTFTQSDNHILLAGPGVVTATPKNGKAQTAKWSQSLDLWLASAEDAKNPGKKTQVLRRALFTGDAEVADANSNIKSESLDVLLAHGNKNGQSIEHVLADGHVNITSLKAGADRQTADVIAANHLELSTTPTETGLPRPSLLLATGNVEATIHGTTNTPAGDKTTRQDIQTQKLTATLEPKQVGKTPVAGDAAEGLGSVSVSTVKAEDGVTITMDGAGTQHVTAKSTTLIADARTGIATLFGDPTLGKAGFAELRQGENFLLGPQIELTQKSQSALVTGAGAFTFFQSGKRGEDPTPVTVSWKKSMTYDGKTHLATLVGSVLADLAGKNNQHSTLSGDQLVVSLANGTDKTGNAPDQSKLKLSEIIATGTVTATGLTNDTQGNMLNRLLLKADQLSYNDTSKVLTIPVPGQMLIEDFRPQSTAATSAPAPAGGVLNNGGSRGSTAFRWSDKMIYDGAANTVTMLKDVVMVHKPTKPLIAPKTGKPAGEGIVVLKTQQLVTVLAQAKGAVASPVALGNAGGTKLSRVTADGGAIIQLDDDSLAADVLEFDADKNLAIAYGRDGNVATATRADGIAQADRIEWDVTQRTSGFTFIRPRGMASAP